MKEAVSRQLSNETSLEFKVLSRESHPNSRPLTLGLLTPLADS